MFHSPPISEAVRLCLSVLCFPWEGYQPIRKTPILGGPVHLFWNTPSPTNPGEEGIADAPGNDGNVSMPEQVKWPNPWRKMMMMVVVFHSYQSCAIMAQRNHIPFTQIPHMYHTHTTRDHSPNNATHNSVHVWNWQCWFIHHPHRLSTTRTVYPSPVPFIHHPCHLSTTCAVYPPSMPFIHHLYRLSTTRAVSTTCTVYPPPVPFTPSYQLQMCEKVSFYSHYQLTHVTGTVLLQVQKDHAVSVFVNSPLQDSILEVHTDLCRKYHCHNCYQLAWNRGENQCHDFATHGQLDCM